MSIPDFDSPQERERYNSSVPRHLLILTLLIPTICIIIGFSIEIPVRRNNIESFLITLVRAESSIIAIIFSIMFLGVQIISSRYTSRMSQLFFSDSLLQITILLLGTAISVDLGLIYFLPMDIQQYYVALVLGSVGLSFVAFYSLILSVRRMLLSSSPEGVIYTASNRISLDNFERYARSSATKSPPTRGLFSFTIGALSEGELLTTRTAFHEYIRVVNDAISEAGSKGSYFYSQGDINRMFSPIFRRQLPEIYIAALREEEGELQQESLACMRQLVQAAYYVQKDPKILSIDGYLNILRRLEGFEDSHSLAEAKILEQVMMQIRFTIEQENRSISKNLIQELHSFSRISNYDLAISNESRNTILLYLPDIHHRLVTKGFTQSDLVFTSKRSGLGIDGEDSPLLQLYALLIEMSLQNTKSETQIPDCWLKIYKNITIYSGYAREDLPDVTDLMIEVSLVLTLNTKSFEYWAEIISVAQYWGSPDEFQRAFEDLERHLDRERRGGLYESESEKGVKLPSTKYYINDTYANIHNNIRALRQQSSKKYKSEVWSRSPPSSIRDAILINPDYIEEGLRPVYSPPRDTIGQRSHLIVAQRAQIGHDSLVMRDEDGTITFIKIVKSINPTDAKDIDNLRDRTYENLQRSMEKFGPLQLRFIIVVPHVEDKTIESFSKHGIEIKQFDIEYLSKYKIGYQSKLTDFYYTFQISYSSPLLQDRLLRDSESNSTP